LLLGLNVKLHKFLLHNEREKCPYIICFEVLHTKFERCKKRQREREGPGYIVCVKRIVINILRHNEGEKGRNILSVLRFSK